ncbi:motility associated factor glycosyltransferase family protein [Butyrivibrio sp. AE3006]|uniref:motility associated factor glycosyltransferase family protein n=1 Tax=Butyrivibrio sp. AE3006 TaxID=1280673 RepID=UPI000426DCA1|nr:6-hydroxymethylpterin diphosphokinase MptE-like protein [Butyrivibrio sp. AE3006]
MLNELLKPDEELRQRNFHEFELKYGFMLSADEEEDTHYQMREGAFGEPVAYVFAGNTGWVRVNSLYSPSYEADRWSRDFSDGCRRCAVAIYGMSTGVYLRALTCSLRPDIEYFLYEPLEDFFSFVCAYVDLTEIIRNPKVKLYIKEEQKACYFRDVHKELVQFKSELKVIVTPFYIRNEAFREACDKLQISKSYDNSFVREMGRSALKARLYAWNHMRFAFLFPDFAKLIPEGTPAIIVSAGPSLHKNIEVLKRIKGHGFIVCVDRAIRVLNEYGIVPDTIVSVDPEIDVSFLKCDIARNVPLIASYQACIDVQELFKNRIIYFQGLVYENGLIGEKSGATLSGIDYGGNVAGAAFCACRDIGIKTIVLIGQDLAYLDGKTHADDTDTGERNMDVLMVEGIDGKEIATTVAWNTFRHFFEEQIKAHPEIRVIDATEGGALIQGSEIRTLDSVADEFSECGFEMKISNDVIPKAQTVEEYLKTKSMLEVWLKVLDIFVDNAKEIVKVCNLFLESISRSDVADEYNKKLIKYLADLREEIFSSVVNFMMEELWIENTDSIPDHEIIIRNNLEGEIVIGREREYFSAFQNDCAVLKEEIVAAINVGIADNA